MSFASLSALGGSLLRFLPRWVRAWALLLAACGGSQQPGPTPTGAGSAAETALPTVEETEGYRVTVLDLGREPRRPLRFDVADGAKENAVMTMSQAVTMTLAGMAIPPQPAIETRMTMALGPARRDGGSFSFPWRTEEVSLIPTEGMEPGTTELLAGAMDGLEGMAGSLTVDGQGRVKDSELEVPEALPPNLRQTVESLDRSLEGVLVVFPSVPLGEGALWEIEQRFEEPIALDQTVRHRWVGTEGAAIILESDVAQSAGPQRVAGPEGPDAGPPLDLEELRGEGSARTSVRLDRLVSKSRSELRLSMVGTVSANGETVPIAMETTVSAGFAPAEGRGDSTALQGSVGVPDAD